MNLYCVGKSSHSLLSFPMHKHDRWELICNFSGCGNMTAGNQTFPFSEGTVVLLPPSTQHEKTSELGFEDHYVQFTGCNFEEKTYILDADPSGHVFNLIRLLCGIWFDGTDRTVCNDLFAGLMGLLLPALTQKQNRFVQQLRRRITEEFTDPDLHLLTLMTEIPINADHLRRLFKQEVGQTPQEYLTRLRLEHAMTLLRNENLSVSEAAFRSGFYDPLYFSRVFRKHMGVSPTKWKK